LRRDERETRANCIDDKRSAAGTENAPRPHAHSANLMGCMRQVLDRLDECLDKPGTGGSVCCLPNRQAGSTALPSKWM